MQKRLSDKGRQYIVNNGKKGVLASKIAKDLDITVQYVVSILDTRSAGSPPSPRSSASSI